MSEEAAAWLRRPAAAASKAASMAVAAEFRPRWALAASIRLAVDAIALARACATLVLQTRQFCVENRRPSQNRLFRARDDDEDDDGVEMESGDVRGAASARARAQSAAAASRKHRRSASF